MGVSLQIPLDEHPVSCADASAAEALRAGYVKRREPARRDSMKRRDALLKGKEGSRRRQRWENDRLLSNPHAQPPQPHDWEIRPTYPVRTVPYYLAPLWDTHFAAASKSRKAAAAKQTPPGADNAGKVPKELREKLKRARGAKGLLESLETEVRRFVEGWESRQKARVKQEAEEGIPLDPDSEDDEIVFVGRNGMMHDMRSPRNSGEIEVERRELLLFESPADDHGASFGRFLVHHIGSYYGLRTWSITTGNPARREAYIGIKDAKIKSGRKFSTHSALPRPLYGLV